MMKGRHYVDGPTEPLKDEAPGLENRSDLAGFYPNKNEENTDPLFFSNIERQQKKDNDAHRHTRGIHRHVISLGVQLVLPYIAILFVVSAVLTITSTTTFLAIIIALILVGMLIIALWIACYRAINRRFHFYTLRGGIYVLVVSGLLAFTTPVLIPLTAVGGAWWLQPLIFSGYLAIASIVYTKIIVSIATHSLWSASRHD